MIKTAFITGATSGIGKATSILLAKNGWNLILNARRENLLIELKHQLESEFKVQVTPLAFDVSDRKSCEQIFKTQSHVFKNMSVLINNAGLAKGVDPMDQAKLEDWDQMIDTNIKGLLYMTRLSVPILKNNLNPHVVNIGSVAGKWVYPGGGVYCSTKFAVRALTESLRMDLHGTGVRVTNISPGLVETNFSQVRLEDETKAKAVYQGLEVLSANDIAESIFWCLSRPKHVNIQELVIFPTDQASVTMVQRQ
jgi:hypothetical protein